ncbi:hypothetical protein LMG26696_01191 [Achromobacter pulmonis]|uniref:hypothetical protein n=1 Tax=Achromobacter pulmonis TaxID=1389932 RepID=UPI0014686B6D|nr:hypothetical protein [Achromobacter pulmonis]CAB3633059.1 hypothetical protein LMG26696_01191 [Achromobacter pulmonis]
MERDSKASAARLAEVWNDTVDLRHLAWAIAIGILISVAGFYAASAWLRDKVASPELAHAYAMLAGCVLSGVICARLFPPKREVVEHSAAHDPAWRAEVLAELAAQPGGLGTLADLPPEVVKELQELGLYELFAAPAAAPAPQGRARNVHEEVPA